MKQQTTILIIVLLSAWYTQTAYCCAVGGTSSTQLCLLANPSVATTTPPTLEELREQRQKAENDLSIARKNFRILDASRKALQLQLPSLPLSGNFMRQSNKILGRNFEIQIAIIAQKEPAPEVMRALHHAQKFQHYIVDCSSTKQRLLMEQLMAIDQKLIEYHLARIMFQNKCTKIDETIKTMQ